MKLADELEERREAIANSLEDAYLRVEALRAELDDLDRAIAALEPAPEPSRAELEAETYGARIHHNDIASIGYADAVGYPPDQPETPIPEGFVAWEGGECPVAEPQAFEVVLANGERRLSNEFFWPWETDSWACGADIGLNIIAYRLLPPTETADETPEPVATQAAPINEELAQLQSEAEQPQGPSPVEGEVDEGWALNLGEMPAFDRVDVKLRSGVQYYYVRPDGFRWEAEAPLTVSDYDIMYYRPTRALELGAVDSIEQPKSPEPVGEDA